AGRRRQARQPALAEGFEQAGLLLLVALLGLLGEGVRQPYLHTDEPSTLGIGCLQPVGVGEPGRVVGGGGVGCRKELRHRRHGVHSTMRRSPKMSARTARFASPVPYARTTRQFGGAARAKRSRAAIEKDWRAAKRTQRRRGKNAEPTRTSSPTSPNQV